MKSLRIKLKGRETSDVVVLSSGLNPMSGSHADIVSFQSPEYRNGQVVFSEGDETVFDSFWAVAHLYELEITVSGLVNGIAVYFVKDGDKKDNKVLEDIRGLKDSGLGSAAKFEKVLDILSSSGCAYFMLDMKKGINQQNKKEIYEIGKGSELPIVILSSTSKYGVHEPVRQHRLKGRAEPIEIKKTLQIERLSFAFHFFFSAMTYFALPFGISLLTNDGGSLGWLLTLLSVLGLAMIVWVSRPMLRSAKGSQNKLGLATTFASISLVGFAVSYLLVYVVSAMSELGSIYPLMSYAWTSCILAFISVVYPFIVVFMSERKGSSLS